MSRFPVASITKLAWVAASVSVLALVGISSAQVKQKTKPTPAAKVFTYAKDVKPFVNQYCGSCHGDKDPVAGLTLTKSKKEAGLKEDAEKWIKVAANVRSSHMPPKGMPAPTKAQRDNFVAAVEGIVVGDCRLADPGKVTLRRLNRAEYNNTVRDLLGVDFRPADDFPSDDVGYGFDNIADVLSISPLLMEKYLNAAEQVVDRALPVPVKKSRIVTGPDFQVTGGATKDDDSCDMSSNSTATVKFNAPQQGLYNIKVSGYGTQGGDQMPIMAVALNGEEVARLEVKGSPARDYEFPVKANKGPNVVAVSFTNDFFDPNLPADKRDRNLILKSIDLYGPKTGDEDVPAFMKQYLPAEPAAGEELKTARAFLAKFATRAYRRPATTDEVDRLVGLFQLTQKAKEPFHRGLQLGMAAVLVSPNFLFKVETTPKNMVSSRALNDYELATRLSYFLWSSMPDDRLMTLAAQGKLRNPDTLATEAKRMLADPKSQALADNFAEQWLNLRKLDIFHPEPEQFPTYNEVLKDSMKAETKTFFKYIALQNRSVLEFLSSDYAFVNAPLAAHYGISGVTGNELRRVALTGTQRGGILSQASVLAITSNPTRTSPVKRGKWILENVLGTPPPPPPPGVGDLGDDKQVLSAKNLREKMELHRKKPDCFSCHSRMDPLGFSLENYDAVGRWRKTEAGAPIDNSGVLPDGQKFQGPAELKKILLQKKDQFTHTLADRLMTYALGRGMDPSDRCVLDDISRRTAANEYRFQTIITEIVRSDPFRKRSAKP